MTERTRVALALGGGGARGYAHIGVIEVLEERGYEIVGISGTSMGALVGGLHAAGRLAPYAEWVGSLTQRDVIRLLDPTLRAAGAIRGDRIMSHVIELLDGVLIEDLPMPFTAVATDLLARKEVWFQQGPVEMAIRASIALPSFIPPVMLNGRLLADGGMTNPVPIAPLSGLRCDATVAVNLSGAREDGAGKAPVTATAEPRPTPEWQERLRRTAAQLADLETSQRLSSWLAGRRHDDAAPAEVEATAASFEDLPADLGMLDVMELSLDALQSVLIRYRLASYPPDVLISVPKNACRTLDFHRGPEMIALGRALAEEALAQRPIGPGS